ncbi:hypothetical protein PV11_07058 [Exophiala sideris]|uniref:Uncharacterized protein n=1 Tax=Exophiala sideris TaxID=1016849 RepID=A0A0D1YXL8_9EURO|nr:hypothetical protein PV11_07058 [Exophiala sideris]
MPDWNVLAATVRKTQLQENLKPDDGNHGYKAGDLNVTWKALGTPADFLACFDADMIPEPGFLRVKQLKVAPVFKLWPLGRCGMFRQAYSQRPLQLERSTTQPSRLLEKQYVRGEVADMYPPVLLGIDMSG